MSIRSNVDARRMDQRILLQRKTETPDGAGGFSVTWADLVPSGVPAAVDGTPLRERFGSNQILTLRDYTFWIRADVKQRFQITPLDRIVWQGVPYDINDMPDQQLRGRLIAIVAVAGANDG